MKNFYGEPFSCWNEGKINYSLTLCLRSLWSLASVWYKTTLNTGGMGGAGADPQFWKISAPKFVQYH